MGKSEKLDGLGDPIDPEADYYVQDKRGTVGNCTLWWAIKSQGYVCSIDEAGVYKGREVRGMRDTDVPWPVAVVLVNVVRHVRVEPLYRAADARAQARSVKP